MTEALSLIVGLLGWQERCLGDFVAEVDSSSLVMLIFSAHLARWPLCNIIRHIRSLLADLGVS